MAADQREETTVGGLDSLLNRIKRVVLEKPGKLLVDSNPNSASSTTTPRAAVALILKPDRIRSELDLLLLKRKERDGDPWSGHMALPGGRFVESDREMLATVIREVMEETGIDLRKCLMLGTLDEVLPSSSPSVCVIPFVALAEGEEVLEITLDPREIEAFLWVPLTFFLDMENVQKYTFTRSGKKFEFPCYRFGGGPAIWGMTLRIIQDLLAKLSS